MAKANAKPAPKQENEDKPQLPAVPDADMFLPVTDVPEYARSTSDNRGNEGVTAQDVATPRLEIVQALSKVRKEMDYPEGALYNSVTHELYGQDVYVIPVLFMKPFLIWRDRKKGGGFRGSYPTKPAAEFEIVEIADKDEADTKEYAIVDTPTHYCLLLRKTEHGVRTEQIAISMPRSHASESKRWNAMVQMFGGARFSRVYRITTQFVTKDDNEWPTFALALAGITPRPLFEAAESLYNRIKAAGGVDIDHASVDPAGGGADNGVEQPSEV